MIQHARRDFLRESASALAGGAALSSMSLADDAHDPIVDTHLHCFAGPDDPRFPYHERAPYRPEEVASPEHLLRCMDGAGVDYAIVVHPEPYQDDHRYLDHCLEVCGDRVKGTCLFFADQPASLRKMPEFLKRHPNRIIAARMHATTPERLPPFDTPEFRQLWKLAADHNLAMQLHLRPEYAVRFGPVLNEFPDVTVIIDHLGRPIQGTPEDHAVIVGWSERPKTIMKISSLQSQMEDPARDIRPIVRQLTDAYGADRMIWGGGFNYEATPASYRAYRETVISLLSHLSEADRQAILGGNAMKLFQFG